MADIVERVKKIVVKRLGVDPDKVTEKPHPITGSPAFDEDTLTRIDADTLKVSRSKAGKVVQTGTFVVSRDGKMITFTSTGTDATGQPYNNTQIYEKQ
jgi:hypothetical protein